MFSSLLIPPRVSPSRARPASVSVRRGVHNLLSVSSSLPLPKRSGYVRNASSPNVVFFFFYFHAAPPGLAVRRGVAQIFQIFPSLPAVQIPPEPAAPADYDAPHVRAV